MPGKREEKREDLRARLVAAARDHIARAGLAGLRARDVTADAGCALGALYTVFADLDGLIFAVNAETLAALERSLAGTAAAAPDPGRRLTRLAAAYLAFARAQPRLWRALFDHLVPEGRAVPEPNMALQGALLHQIAAPLATLQPDLEPEALAVRARTLFAAVHGIVSISLEDRFVGLPVATLDQEIERFIGLLLAGLEAERVKPSTARARSKPAQSR